MRIRRILLLLLLLAAILPSCSIKKRLYQPGYQIVWSKKNSAQANSAQENKHRKEIGTDSKLTAENSVDSIKNEEIKNSFIGSIEKSVTPLKKNLSVVKLSGDDCGDIITLTDGTSIKIKIIEISENELKYKRCDNLDGPLFIVPLWKVAYIKYQNGTEEKIDKNKKETAVQNKKMPNEAVSGFILSLIALGVFFLLLKMFLYALASPYGFQLFLPILLLLVIGIALSVLAIMFCAQALKKIAKNPLELSGNGLALAGLILGILGWLAFLVILFRLF